MTSLLLFSVRVRGTGAVVLYTRISLARGEMIACICTDRLENVSRLSVINVSHVSALTKQDVSELQIDWGMRTLSRVIYSSTHFA